MSDGFEDQPWVRLGVSAALESEYLKDQKSFVRLLAATLQAALPDETEVQTRGLFKKSLAAITVTFQGDRYSIISPEHGAVHATKTHIVRGIALKTEPIEVEACLAEIARHLEERAAKSATTCTALANMLGLQ